MPRPLNDESYGKPRRRAPQPDATPLAAARRRIDLNAPHPRRKALRRLFQRSAVPEMLRGQHWGQPLPGDLSARLLDVARATPEALLARLHSQPDGLGASQAATIRRRTGPNEIARAERVAWPLHLWHCYRNPFNLLLSALAAVSGLTHDARAAMVILAMVALSTLMRFGQEARSQRAAEALRGRVGNRVTVLRRVVGAAPHETELAVEHLVPGDVVRLAAGDMFRPTCACSRRRTCSPTSRR